MVPDNDKKATYVLPESTALAAIGGLDLLYTVYLLATHQAHEANPLFNWILHSFGAIGFIAAKAVFLAIPLTMAELARQSHPQFVRKALRICLVLYIAIYAVSYLRTNVHLATEAPEVRIQD